jgi:hypothetical protein
VPGEIATDARRWHPWLRINRVAQDFGRIVCSARSRSAFISCTTPNRFSVSIR